MKRRIIRLISAVTLCTVLAGAFAFPAKTVSAAQYVNDGTLLRMDMGNVPTARVMLPYDIKSIQCFNYKTLACLYDTNSQYIATGTNVNGPYLPYSKLSTAGPAMRAYMTNAANSLGYKAGDAFEIEIGTYANGIGYSVCPQLFAPMLYELNIYPLAGYAPSMLALLPNGVLTELSGAEFIQTYSNTWYPDGSHLYYLNTCYPKAVYMMVYKPVK